MGSTSPASLLWLCTQRSVPNAVCVHYNSCPKPDQITWLRELHVPWPTCSQPVTMIQWQTLLVLLCIAVLNPCEPKQRWGASGVQLLYLAISCKLHGGATSSSRWGILLLTRFAQYATTFSSASSTQKPL